MNHKKLHIFNFLISLLFFPFSYAMNPSAYLGKAQSTTTFVAKHQPPKKSNQDKSVVTQSQLPQADEIYNSKNKFAQGFAEFENILLDQNKSSQYNSAEIELELLFSLSKMIESKNFLNSKSYSIDPSNILNQIYRDLDKECTEQEMLEKFEQIKNIKNDLLKDQTTTTNVQIPTEKVSAQENERIRSQKEIKKIERLTEAINNAASLFFSVNDQKKNELCEQVNNHIKDLSELIALDSQNSGTRIRMLENLTLNTNSTQQDVQNIITIVGLVSRITLTKKRSPEDLLSSKTIFQQQCADGNYWSENISDQVAYISNLTISDELKLFILQLMWWSIVGKEFTEEEHDISKKTPSLINIAIPSVSDRTTIYRALRYLREKNKNNKNLIIHEILPSIKKEQNHDFPWFYNHKNLNIYLEELKNHKNSIESEKQTVFLKFLTSVEKWFEGTKTTLKKQTSSVLLENLRKEQINLIDLSLFNENNNIPNNLDKDCKRFNIYLNKLKDYAIERLKEVNKQITNLEENNDQKISNDMLLQCLQDRITKLKELLTKIPTIDIKIVEYEYIDTKSKEKKIANINVNYNGYSEITNKTYFEEIQDRINKEIKRLEEKINELSPKIEITLNDVINALGKEPFTELSDEELNNTPPTDTVTSSTIIKEEHVSPPTIPRQIRSNTNPFSLSTLHIANGTTPPQPTVTENKEQEEIKKQEEKIKNALLFMKTFTGFSFSKTSYTNVKSYIDSLYTLAENYNNQDFSEKIKKILNNSKIIEFLNQIIFSSLWNHEPDYNQQMETLKSACGILADKHNCREFTWINNEMKRKRNAFEKLFNYINTPHISINPNNTYLQEINNLYPRTILDKEKREKLINNYNNAVLKNTTEYEEGIKELNLPFETKVLSDLYDEKFDPSTNKLNKNLFIYKALLKDIFENLDKGLLSTLWNWRKYKKTIENFEQRKSLFPQDTIDSFDSYINNYKSKSWTTLFCKACWYIVSLEWLIYYFPNI